MATLAEAIGLSSGEALAHGVVEHEGLGQALIDPGRDLSGRRRPADRVGDVRLDLAHAFIAMLQHALVPFGIEHARARLERDLLGQRAHLALAARLIADIDRNAVPVARLHGAADAAESVEVVVDGRDAELDRFEVLIGELDVGQHGLQQCRCCLIGVPCAP